MEIEDIKKHDRILILLDKTRDMSKININKSD